MIKTIVIPLSITLILSLIIYIFIIFEYPFFIQDDYCIFYIIASNPSQPISISTNELFFLFVRPVSYLILWLQYNLFYTDAAGMKIVGLLFHLVYLGSFYLLIYFISDFLKIKFNAVIAFVFTIIVSFHADSLAWVIWVSNQTELLGVLFYSISFLSLLLYASYSKNIFLYLYPTFYLLSVLSKQQGLHLPLLIIFFILIFREKINKESYKKLRTYSIVNLVFAFFYSILNFIIYKDTLNLSENFWKKPFSAIGILIHSVIPGLSQYIYNFFILNKGYSVVLLVAVFVLLILILLKNRNYVKPFLLFAAGATIIFFPRIFGHGSMRLNGIIIFWLALVFALVLMKINLKKILLIPLILLYLALFAARVSDSFYLLNKYDEETVELNKISGERNNTIIISDEYSYRNNFKTYFFKHSSFGYDTSYRILPLYFDVSLIPECLRYKENIFSFSIQNDEFSLRTTSDLVSLLIDQDYPNTMDISIMEKKASGSGRGYSYIKFKLSDRKAEDYNFIYHNGQHWEQVK